jgi:hypothetical protein
VIACARIAGLLTALLVPVAHSDSGAPSLFGISLGQDVAEIPICPFIPNTLYFHGTELCLIKSTRISKAWGAEEFDVNLPPEKPSYLFNMTVAVLDGKIVEVAVGTNGLSYQNEVYRALQSKFGKPAWSKTDVIQNAFGATFKRLRAQWRLKNASLTMYGGETSTNMGAIYLSDNAYGKRVDQYTKDRENKLKP